MTKKYMQIFICAHFFVISAYNVWASEVKNLGTISGEGFLAIQAAVPELAKYGLKISNYTVSVIARESSIFVLFKDPEQPPHVFGSMEPKPGFEVEITKDRAEVIRSYFTK